MTVTENNFFVQASLDGRMASATTRTRSSASTVNGALSRPAQLVAIPPRLFFSAEDSLTVQPVDALAPDAPAIAETVKRLLGGFTTLLVGLVAFAARAGRTALRP